MLGALPADSSRDGQHYPDHSQSQQSQWPAQHYHHHQSGNHRDQCRECLRHALAYQLPQGVDVVRVYAHDVAVRVRVEVLERQPLHPGEHFVPDVLLHSLRYDDFEPALDIAAANADRIDTSEYQYCLRQSAPVRSLLPDKRSDDVIYQVFGEQRHYQVAERPDDHHHQHEYHLPLVLAQVFQQSQDGSLRRAQLLQALLCVACPSSHRSRHYSAPPFSGFPSEACELTAFWL